MTTLSPTPVPPPAPDPRCLQTASSSCKILALATYFKGVSRCALQPEMRHQHARCQKKWQLLQHVFSKMRHIKLRGEEPSLARHCTGAGHVQRPVLEGNPALCTGENVPARMSATIADGSPRRSRGLSGLEPILYCKPHDSSSQCCPFTDNEEQGPTSNMIMCKPLSSPFSLYSFSASANSFRMFSSD